MVNGLNGPPPAHDSWAKQQKESHIVGWNRIKSANAFLSNLVTLDGKLGARLSFVLSLPAENREPDQKPLKEALTKLNEYIKEYSETIRKKSSKPGGIHSFNGKNLKLEKKNPDVVELKRVGIGLDGEIRSPGKEVVTYYTW
jgi:hypothetical protein